MSSRGFTFVVYGVYCLVSSCQLSQTTKLGQLSSENSAKNKSSHYVLYVFQLLFFQINCTQYSLNKNKTIKMAFSRLARFAVQCKHLTKHQEHFIPRRSATTTPTGAILPEPEKTPFGLLGIVCAVVPGLLIGAAISKNIANFLEENELFVPSDDDDDDD